MFRDLFIILFFYMVIQLGFIIYKEVRLTRRKPRAFPILFQKYQVECGPVCLQMIAKYYGKTLKLESICYLAGMDLLVGTNLKNISTVAKVIGLKTIAVKIFFQSHDPADGTLKNVPLPCMLHWERHYFVVLYDRVGKYVYIAHPQKGALKMDEKTFCKSWTKDGTIHSKGVALLFEKTTKF